MLCPELKEDSGEVRALVGLTEIFCQQDDPRGRQQHRRVMKTAAFISALQIYHENLKCSQP